MRFFYIISCLLATNLFAMISDYAHYFAPNAERYKNWEIHSYGDDPQQNLYMNIPKDRKDFPTVVWFHGGGMVGDAREIPEELWDGEICVIEARYRTIHEDHKTNSLDALDDATACVAWVLTHIAEFGGNPKEVFIGGMSAGGYLSAMVGMCPKMLAKYGFDHRQLAGLLICSGQVSTHFQLKVDLGYDRLGVKPVIDEYAPLYYAAADIAPILLVTGEPGLDMGGRPEENALLAATLVYLGHKDAKHCILQGHDHVATVQASGWLFLQFVHRIIGR